MADIKKLYVIGYDLIGKHEKDYEELFKAILSIDKDAAHELDSTWLIFSTQTAAELRDALKAHLHDTDKLMVLQVTKEADWATKKLPKTAEKLNANV